MSLSKTGAGFLVTFIFGISGQASADFLEEFSRTQAFAQETLKIMHAESYVETPYTDAKKKVTKDHFHTALDKKGVTSVEIDHLIQEKASRFGINPDFIRAVVRVESGYNVSARSPKGAIGLMQLMPTTASILRVRNPWDPKANLEGGIHYLARLLWEFRDVKDALVAYNAGPNVVRRNLTVPHETRRYVRSVLNHFNRSLKRHREID